MGRIVEHLARLYLVEALRQSGVTLEQVEAWESGAELVPAQVARDAVRLGIPLDWWPRIGREYRIRSPRRSSRGITDSVNATTHPEAHAKRVAAITAKAHARSHHPFLRWLGPQTVAAWAGEHGYTASAVQSYLRRGKARRTAPEAFRARVAALSGGLVPPAAWDE